MNTENNGKLDKAIQGLRCCKPYDPDCQRCPYWSGVGGECIKELHSDAVELLREVRGHPDAEGRRGE